MTAMNKMDPLPGGCESRCAPPRGVQRGDAGLGCMSTSISQSACAPALWTGPSGNDLAFRRVAVLRRLAEFLTGVPRLENLCCLLDEQWHDLVEEVTPPIVVEIISLGSPDTTDVSSKGTLQ